MNFLQVTQQTIQKQWNWMLIPKLITPSLLVTLIVLVVRLSTYIANIDSRSFKDVETRVKTEAYIESALTPVEVYKMRERIEDLEEAYIRQQGDIQEMKDLLKSIEKSVSK